MGWTDTPVTGGPLDPAQLDRVHRATLAVLQRTGLRVDCADFHGPLEAAGARVDRASGVVTFPPAQVEGMLDALRRAIASGRRQHLLNGVTNPRWTPPPGLKFGGACIEYLDPEARCVRTPTQDDLIRLLQLGEALPGVGFVGNPVACLAEADGRPVPGPMQRIRTAALVAKHTTKCGSAEVWNARELDFLLEIGEIVRGGRETFRAQPCFVTAKETIAPLQFPADDGRVLLLLARQGLPCTVIPMPITGATAPCTPIASVVMANAEILGALACLHAAVPEASIGGGVISGVLDMATGIASFSAPETLLQDAALAQLYDDYYGQDLAIGTGYIDAKHPGAQALAEKALKMQAAARQGRHNHPVGLLAGGKRFCPVEAVMELEIAGAIGRLQAGLATDDDTLAVDIIAEVGIGGQFISHEHTYEHFRGLWRPALLDRRMPDTLAVDLAGDIIDRARQQVFDIRARDDLYRIDDARSRAIDDVVARAERALCD